MYYNFTVPSGASTANVNGAFTVAGGNESGTRVCIMDSANFTDWQNGQKASNYYDSGEVNNGTITTTLYSGGTYFLVYDNTVDAASQKTLNTQVHFSYMPKD